MATSTLSSIVLFLALYSLFIQTVLGGAPTVSFVSNIKKRPQVTLNCTHTGIGAFSESLIPGKKYTMVASLSSQIYYCNAMWGRFFAGIRGWNSTRDAGHSRLFWKVDEIGWYLKYKTTNFVKQEDWETE